MGKRSKWPVAQRREAVLMLLRGEEPAVVLPRRFEVSQATLYRWRDDFLRRGDAALCAEKANGQARRIEELERQVAERDAWLGRDLARAVS